MILRGKKRFPSPLAIFFLLPAVIIAAALLGGCQSINRDRQALGLERFTVILSFDDGPNAHQDTTARLLEVLQKYGIHAVFALLGENAEHSPELVRRIRDEGHCIVNHGYSEKWAWGMDDDSFRENLVRGEEALVRALGEYPEPRLYRPQGGFYRAGQEKIWREAGYALIGGSARIYDAVMDAADQERAAARIIGLVEKQQGGVILLHDGRDSHVRMEAELAKNGGGCFNRAWIPGAVEEIISSLLARGYRFVTPDPADTEAVPVSPR